MPPAIRIDNLSKLYHIGVRQKGYKTLRESLADAASVPFQRLGSWFRRPSPQPPAPSPSSNFWALKDVSFEVQPGEVVGIIGRNGAGKSTLLKILSRITEPTSGRVELRGRVGSLLEVGTGFHPELSGRENIYMNGSILGMSRREIARKFDEIVDFSGIEDFLETPVKRYSSGMYVRLAFSVAAHLEPEILIVDEVLAVGDAEFQKKCLGKMHDVARGGRTVLFVSHNMAAVSNLCESVLVLNHGKVQYRGDCQGGIKNYLQGTVVEESSQVDLESHPNRLAGSTPYLRTLRFLDANGVPKDDFACGDPMELELTVAADVEQMILSINIDDSVGVRLFTVGTPLARSGHLPIRGQRRVLCRIDHLPLAPGSYCVRLKARPVRSTNSDVIEQAAWFEVHPTDFYGNGCAPRGQHGRFAVRSHWSLVEEGVALETTVTQAAADKVNLQPTISVE